MTRPATIPLDLYLWLRSIHFAIALNDESLFQHYLRRAPRP